MARADLRESDGNRAGSGEPVALLILDDSFADREIIKRLLASDPQREYTLSEYGSIEDALDACSQTKPDCVLLDYSLGDGTGLDFLKAVRGKSETHDVPVVMLTGSGSEEVAADAFRAGAHDYLAKGTLTADGLQRAISGAIYKSQTDRLLETQKRELERLFREAKEANAMKDQFLATLSHELRTPLTPVLTAVTAANPRELSHDELADLFGTVRRNILLEARLIDDLLDLTRITNGKLLLEMRPCDAHDVLRHAIETVSEEVQKKELTLTTHLDAARTLVLADSARLQQVFWNLLKNAVKFTPSKGSITITTRTTNDEHLEVAIRDTGIGIAPEVLPHIFRAFEQGTDVPRRFGGLGLGLAIANALVHAHQGALRAESDGRDRGATFFVGLPLLSVESGVHLVRDGEASSLDGADGASEPLSAEVLLVEDHADSANVLARFLSRRGLKVTVAHSVEEAARIFDQHHVDIVISDIGLPDGSGVELMSRLCASRRVPGIALSGYGTEDDMSRSRNAGFVEHLIKPVEWTKLIATVTRILKSQQPD